MGFRLRIARSSIQRKTGSFLQLFWICLVGLVVCAESASADASSNIHAVIVASSRYWFNYRHAMNALGIYHILQQNGVPDSQIVLMIADEYATNARNPNKNGMFANGVKKETWYSEKTEVDFRGSDVTVQNFVNAVLGIGPRSLKTANEDSNLLIFVSGHGGDQFFKFQDEEELMAQDIANLMDELAKRKKFKKALFIADTCQAFTLFDKLETKNVWALGTSLRGENAYAHHSDSDLGLSVIERWSHGFVNQYKRRKVHPATTTLHELMVQPFKGKTPLGAHVGVVGDFRKLLLTDFFGSSVEQRKGQAAKVFSKSSVVEVKDLGATFVPPRKKENTDTARQLDSDIHALNDIKHQSSPLLEPEDPIFGLYVCFLIFLVLLSSILGKTKISSDSAVPQNNKDLSG